MSPEDPPGSPAKIRRFSSPVPGCSSDPQPKRSKSPLRIPNIEESFVFYCVGNYSVADYLHAIRTCVHGGKSIVYASPIRDGKITVHLKNKLVLNDFMSKHGGFTMQKVFFPCYRASQMRKTLHIINVPPEVPNEAINIYLRKNKLKLTSPMIMLPICPNEKSLGHVIGWTREVEVLDDINLQSKPHTWEIQLFYGEMTFTATVYVQPRRSEV